MSATTGPRPGGTHSRLDVLVVGGIGVDDAVYLNEPLRPGMWTQATPEQRSTAGSAATIAVALAGAGLTVALAGAVGTDTVGDWLRQTLTAAGVECHIRRVSGPSPRSLVLVEPSGERSIIGLSADLLEHAVAALPLTTLPGACTTFLIPAWRPQFSDVLNAAQQAGARTVVGLRALADPALRAHVAVGSERELGGVDPRTVLDRFDTIVVTIGTRGARVLTADRQLDVAPVAVEAVDATGAGDAFLAGLVAGLAHGEPLFDALRLAAAWGAAAVARRGTVAPPYEQALQLREMAQ